MTQRIIVSAVQTTKFPGDRFSWVLGEDSFTAERSVFFLADSQINPGEKTWSFHGSCGTGPEGNYFSFDVFLPYQGDDELSGIYTLETGLKFVHGYSIPAPPGWVGLATAEADAATLIIDYDRSGDRVNANFDAVFEKLSLTPVGQFTLTREYANVK